MRFSGVLETVTRTLAGLRPGGRRGDERLAALDRGVLSVALLLASLDGTILAEEYAAFAALAKKCRGSSDRNLRKLLGGVLGEIGTLMAMAQVGVYTEKERLDVFLAAAVRALPGGFAGGTLADARRAFALWVAIGVADGAFSPLERQALGALAERYAQTRRAQLQASVDAVAMSTPFSREGFERPRWIAESPVLESDFFERAEKIVRRLASPAKREAAEAEFESLVRGSEAE